MKQNRKYLLAALLAVALAAPLLAGITADDIDLTSDVAPSFVTRSVLCHGQGQYTSATDGICYFVAPTDMVIISVYGTCRAKTGTIKYDVNDNGTTILDAAATVATAGTMAAATLDNAFPDQIILAGHTVRTELDTVGTSCDDLTVQINWRPLVGAEAE